MLLRLAAAILCLTAVVKSQGGEERPAPSLEDRRKVERLRSAMEEKQRSERGEGEEKSEEEMLAALTPEERLARTVITGASSHCRFYASLRPAKLLPGQTGVLLVTAALQGQAVIPAPARFEIVGRPKNGVVEVGNLSVRPAEPGRLAPGYLGKPVHDNFALLEIPITLSPQAQVGSKHPVAIDLKFDLYDGNSAQPVGRFVDRVSTEVEVGQPLDPAVRAGTRQQASVDPVQQPAATTTSPGGATPGTATDPVPLVGKVTPVPEPDAGSVPGPAAGGRSEPELLPVDDAGLPLPILVGAGALVVGLLVLLLRKR